MEINLNENRLAELERLPNTASPAVVRELVHRLREAEKAAERMREALQAISTMQGRAYYKVCPNETAKDAHLIAVGALANDAGEMREAKGVNAEMLEALKRVSSTLEAIGDLPSMKADVDAAIYRAESAIETSPKQLTKGVD